MHSLPFLTRVYGADLVQTPQVIAFVAGSAFAMGSAIGSFLNVCISRLPVMSLVTQYKQGDAQVRREILDSLDEDPKKAQELMDGMVAAKLGIARPRSHCPKCKSMIAWHDNVPMASWLLLRGRCRHCGLRISPMYPLIEALCGIMFAYLVMRFDVIVGTIDFAVFAAMLVITGVDIAIYEIPDEIVLPGIPLGLLASLVLPVGIRDAAIGAVVGGAIPYAIAKGYFWLTKREGLGFGDVKMLAMIGAFFGWQGVISVLLLASAVGSVVGLAWIAATRRQARALIPFGPFLAAGTVAYMLAGPQIVAWYQHFFR